MLANILAWINFALFLAETFSKIMRMNRINRIVLCAILLLGMNVNAGETMGEARVPAARRFTLERAIITALQQNPNILIARQEIERTKGLFIQLRAAAMPQIIGTAQFQDLDPHITNFSGVTEQVGTSFTNQFGTERTYTLQIAANQVIFSGGRVPGQISSASFQRDSSYYGFRNAVDQVVATVRQQFYLVLLDRALIGVQEESVRLLQSHSGSTEPVRGGHSAAFQCVAGSSRAFKPAPPAHYGAEQLYHFSTATR